MANNRITITLLGSKADSEDVRLPDFIEQLEAVREALRQTERVLSGSTQQSLYYKIVDLSHASPAAVTIEACRIKAGRIGIAPNVVANTFLSSIRTLKVRRKPPARADLPMLESYKLLGASPNIQQLTLSTTPKKVVAIDGSFSERVEQAIGPDVFAPGSVSGRLERINLHNTNTFDIYPPVGPVRVHCEFRNEDRELVRQALDRFITVKGRLRYKTWDKHPYAISVSPGKIDIHEKDSDLPDIEELRGIAPDATGEMASEDFVRVIRDANW
jgi:hypothetical protein